MKRSEMIKAIETEYRDFLDQIDLNALLDFLVSKGMQPPAYNKFVEAQGLASPSPDIKLYYKLPCNEWEPEDEKK